MVEDDNKVDVGYIDHCEPWRLESRFFPSKVGGRPAWLNLSDLPMPSDLECTKCKSPLTFLGQVYAPIEIKDDCFHRSLFIFFCCNVKCCLRNDNSSFVVLRCQLARRNNFYPYDPPQDSETWHPDVKTEKWSNLCFVCGCQGPSQCGRCKKVRYCSRQHQIVHWKGSHKQLCGKNCSEKVEDNTFSCLLPEYELITEPEDCESQSKSKTESEVGSDSDSDGEGEEERLRAFEELQLKGGAGTLSGLGGIDADLIGMAACEEDKVFAAFKSRITQNPGQVLRYERGGKPLWVSDNHVPSDQDIKLCPHCGSRRIFEFQILPQLLNHLSLDALDQSVDWGVLSVFTCMNSCNDGPAYKMEFLWKQDV